MSGFLQTILLTVAGSAILINGVVFDADKIIGDTKSVVNQANIHQLATVMEIYYLDHNRYPEARGGEELIELLGKENYIRNTPLDPTVFEYKSVKGGQDYILSLK